MAHLGLERVLEPSWLDEVFNVVQKLRAGQPTPCPGYRVRVADGNCLAPTSQPRASSRSTARAALSRSFMASLLEKKSSG
jgi:hypothetical protein